MMRLCVGAVTVLVALLIHVLPCTDSINKYVSPYEFGLGNAKSGTDCYYVLLKTHKAAIKRGCGVSYKGIKIIELNIPQNAKSIPLPDKVDFCGTKLIVKNNSKDFTLFCNTQDLLPINIDKKQLASNDYRSIPHLRKDISLLVIQDKTPWLNQRRGYSYGVNRKDLLLIKNGKAVNKTIQPYSDSDSKPVFYYCTISQRKKEYKNLIFERSLESKYITRLFLVENQYNVELRNIQIITPESTLYGDKAIMIYNSAKVLFKDVKIDGTYSQKNDFGYGINMNNVWNVKFNNLTAHANWGVFGNNNVNNVVIKNSDINRFDVHCYGCDVFCYNTTFRNMYNQISSFYGDLIFKGCRFIKFVPVMFEDSYSAYTYFNLTIEDCELEVDENRTYLIHAGSPSKLSDNPRGCLSHVSWPNITIKGLKVYLPNKVKEWRIFAFSGEEKPLIEGINNIHISGLSIEGGNRQLVVKLSNKKINTQYPISVKVSSSSIKKIKID